MERAREEEKDLEDIEVDPDPIPTMTNVRKRVKDLDDIIRQSQGREDNEQPRDSLYIKDPEELKKALIWHHGNYSRLRSKSMRGELTDEEYDSLKHSEGELELHDQLER